MPEYKNNGAVWVKKTKAGAQYLAFKADRDIKEGEWLNLFKPKKRNNDKAPHFTSFDVIDDNAVTEDVEIETGDVEDIDLDNIPDF